MVHPSPCRLPRLAGTWYPSSANEIRAFVDAALEHAPSLELDAHACLAPHAGWRYSGAIAARAIAALLARPRAPERILFFGAVHVRGAPVASVDAHAEWSSPAGSATLDGALTRKLLSEQLVRTGTAAHAAEHSLEVLLPIVQTLAPHAKLLPILVPPDARALALGRRLAELCADAETVAIASTDLTHHGPRFGFEPGGAGATGVRWARRNDASFLERAASLDAAGCLDLAQQQRNACGAGAVAAAIEFATARGADHGLVLEQAQSLDAMGEDPADATDVVGYGSVLLGTLLGGIGP